MGSLAIAGGCGFAALYWSAWAMRTLMRLRADGTAHIENAIGQSAVVYLTIPGHRAGKGKITVTVQNRTMEYEAETEHEPLADRHDGASRRHRRSRYGRGGSRSRTRKDQSCLIH